MSQYLDGISSAASQHGPKQISLPLQADGNYHATLIRRNYIAAPASAYEPIIGQRTAYTSLLRYSDDFSQANWVKVNATAAVTSAINDPEGGVTASKLAEDTTNGAHNASQVCVCTAGATAFGVFAKAAERTFVRLRLYNATDGSLGNAVFNLSTGVLVSGTGTIKKLLYGWYWCAIAQTAAVANSTLFVDIGSDATTFSYTGTTGSGVYLWRATAYLSASIGPAIATTSTTPTAVTCPPVDADDPTAFLVSEQELDSGNLEIGIAKWSREYSNIPRATTSYSSLIWTSPNAPSSGTYRYYGTYGQSNYGLFYQPVSTMDRYEIYRVTSVSSDQGAVNIPTGGTWDLSFGGSSIGSLNYAITAGALKIAIDAMTSVSAYGGLSTLTGNYSDSAGFIATFNDYAAAALDTTNLVYGDSISATAVTSNGGWRQDISIEVPYTQISAGITLDPSGLTGWTLANNAVGYSVFRTPTLHLESSTEVTGGYFTITLFGETTSSIAWDANAITVSNAINALSTVQSRGGVSILSDASHFLNFNSSTHKVFFVFLYFGRSIILSGTYTITLFGQTSGDIPYNASLADISLAINSLSEVIARGGVAISLLYNYPWSISYRLSFNSVSFYGNGTSLTPTSGSVLCIALSGGRSHSIKIIATQFSRLITCASNHGLTVGDKIFAYDTSYHMQILNWNLVSATQISVDPAVSPWNINTPFTYIGKFLGYYSPGPSGFSTKKITEYYLPEFTPGIASEENLPAISRPISDSEYFDAIILGEKTVPYSESEISRWKGPILTRTKVEINTELPQI